MNVFWVSLSDLAGRLSAPNSVDTFSSWLGCQVFQELDARGVPTGRTGRALEGDHDVDLGRVLPVLFAEHQEEVPYKRIRLLRSPPRLDVMSLFESLERAFRNGCFMEILEVCDISTSVNSCLQVFRAASLAEIGRFEESLEVWNTLASVSLTDELLLFRQQALMDTLRRCGRPAEALDQVQSLACLEGISVLRRARYFIKEAAARQAADSRDALALPTLDRAINVLSAEHPTDFAEALMHRGRFMRNEGQLDEAEALLKQALILLDGSEALHLCGRVFGNLAGINLDRSNTKTAILFASAAACCFRHVGCLHDLLNALSIIATDDPDSDTRARYKREASTVASVLRYPSPAVSLPLLLAADNCGSDELSCLRSAGGVGVQVFGAWSEDRAFRTGVQSRQLLFWTVLGAKMYHAAVRRGRPAMILESEAIAEAAERWYGEMEQHGTNENVQYRGVLHYLEDEFPGTHLQFATTALNIFRTEVNVPLDGTTEKAVYDLILDSLLMGFRLEFAFDNACAEVLEVSQMKGGLEELLKFPAAENGIDVVDVPALTRLVMPDARPWPVDLHCLCGAGLQRFIYCCAPENPIEIASYADKLRPGFQIKRECCGAMLSGFRCDCCHQIYTWDLSVDEEIQ